MGATKRETLVGIWTKLNNMNYEQLCQYESPHTYPYRHLTFHCVINSVFKYCTVVHELTTLCLSEMAWHDILSGPGKSVESTTSIT